jgi:hypothetical protein
VQAITFAFKDDTAKFSGNLDESLTDYLRQYDVVCRNLSISVGRKFDLMHNIFRDDAKEWFFANIAEKHPSLIGGYPGAVRLLIEEYQSLTRQERIKQLLDCITFDQFVEGTGTHADLKSALDKLKTRIVKLTQQCPPAFRGVEHQLAHLRRAVIGKPWSELPLQTSPPYEDLNKLVAALGASIQHDATKTAQAGRSSSSTTLPTFLQTPVRLRNPTYGRTRWERGRLVPAHKGQNRGTNGATPQSHGVPGSREHSRDSRFLNKRRTWIDERTGLLRPGTDGKERSCHRCGGDNHLSFEVELCDPLRSKNHIATRFAAGDTVEDVFMDVLDTQLTPEEFDELDNHIADEEGDITSQEHEDITTSFVKAFETRFLTDTEARLSHSREREV